ncbi:MAG: type II secretion system protein [Desulfobulbaceae bacterium]|nr:type II secretion system protein [Desulfobulbaceae bacterium]
MTKYPKQPHRGQRGFTLIEIIITLVVLGILSSMLVTVVGVPFTSSSQPIFRLQQTMSLQQTMENIRANFAATKDLGTFNFDSFKGTIGATGSSQQNNFGTYVVVSNSYIKFNASSHNEEPGVEADGVLKVSIKDQSSGLILTELFVIW